MILLIIIQLENDGTIITLTAAVLNSNKYTLELQHPNQPTVI